MVFLAVWSPQTSSLDTFCQGNITRQEAVSMLPPLFLDVEPHHVVLDMCAAPGSKVRFFWLVAINLPLYNTHTHAQTSQLLESLHSSQSLLESSIPRGLLIANDNDYKRTHVLIHHSSLIASYVTYPAVEMEQFAKMSVSGKSGMLWMAMVCTRTFQSRLIARESRDTALLGFSFVSSSVPCACCVGEVR